ncbi:hypothetical protein J1N35_029522 [Gossypium stocksii]|uniref:Reverse transcriptase zinc-binding domain-containing protein n=1 Tax=Gossypium stocksii TaxID=47602 RepID=A0A9D3UYE6_9ROSI|nr:hypothetical protein J1N35_029522 [Gossypium stocksii]
MGQLIKFILATVNFDSGCCLNNIVNEDGSWNLDLFRIWLPEEVVELIMGIPPPIPSEGLDRITWCHTFSGNFSVKNACKVCKGDEWNAKDEKWKCVWKILGRQKVRFFIWLVLKQRILSNVERVKRGLADDPSCSLCGCPSEDILHILRDCNAAKDVQSQVLPGQPWSSREIVNNSLCWASQWHSPSSANTSGGFDLPLEEQVYEFTIFLNTDGAVRLDNGHAFAGGDLSLPKEEGMIV